MKLQIITYQLNGITEAEYTVSMVVPDAPRIAQTLGLVSKVWVANAEENTYGGIYLWQNESALNDFMASALVKEVMARPYLTAICSTVYDVKEEASRITRGIS